MNGISCWLTLAMGLFLAGDRLGAAEKPEASSPRRLPAGGVADPAGKIGYWPNPGGGIDALELATGKLLWSTSDATRPLLATGDRLLAQAAVPDRNHQLRVVVLDAHRQGKRLLESKPVEFPPWVHVPQRRGHSFKATARLNTGRLLLTWEARAWYDGGADIGEERERAARKHASGVVQIDLASGRVNPLKGDQLPKGTPQDVPDELQTATVGDRVYSVAVGQPVNATQVGVAKCVRTLQAADASGKVLWKREIATLIEFLALK